LNLSRLSFTTLQGRPHRAAFVFPGQASTSNEATPRACVSSTNCGQPHDQLEESGKIQMEALLTSTLVVALAEIGDKTQLLAMVLAARFRRPLPIVAGILVATLANHFLAALAGYHVAGLLEGAWFRYAVGASFLAMAAWTLVPDKLDDDEGHTATQAGAFMATLVAFFLVEIGDKTQVATIALAARFEAVTMVTLGTTLGMLLANAPVVWLGDRLVSRLPLGAVRIGAALLFLALGVWVLATA